jgi:hypothetical protein
MGPHSIVGRPVLLIVAVLATLVGNIQAVDPLIILEQGFTDIGGKDSFLIPVDDDYYTKQLNFMTSRMTFDHDFVRIPLEITFAFQTAGFWMNATDEIKIRLPRFTSGLGMGEPGPSFEIQQHSWATMFQLLWEVRPHFLFC